MTTYIKDQEHYNKVLSLCANVKHTLWIGTADIKDLYVKLGTESAPFLFILSTLVKRGVSVRVLHAKKPGENFQQDFRRYANLKDGIEMMLCPRVHFKILVFDCEQVYFGSANLTGAGIGMKGVDKRNFEAGILTSEPVFVENAMEHFDSVWRGARCKQCKRKTFCSSPIR